MGRDDPGQHSNQRSDLVRRSTSEAGKHEYKVSMPGVCADINYVQVVRLDTEAYKSDNDAKLGARCTQACRGHR